MSRRQSSPSRRCFVDIARHCGFAISPCKVARGSEKGRAESEVGYIKKNFLRGLELTEFWRHPSSRPGLARYHRQRAHSRRDAEVHAWRPNDADPLIPAIETHRASLGRTPYLVAADAGFNSAKNEAASKDKGVKRVWNPNRLTKSKERRRHGQKWRTGRDGRARQ